MMKRLISWVIGTFALVLALLAAEGLVRFLLPEYDPSGMVRFYRDPSGAPLGVKNSVSRQWKNTGDFDVSVRINSDGLRDAKLLASARPEDWFVVGDSFVFGMGVEENERFTGQLEAKTGKRFFNLGIPAANLLDYAALLAYARSNGAALQNVILAVCMENDVDRYDAYVKMRKGHTDLSGHLTALKNTLTMNSALYNLVTTGVHRSRFLSDLGKEIGVIRDIDDSVSPNYPEEDLLADTARKIQSALADVPNAFVFLVPSRALWTGNAPGHENEAHIFFKEKLESMGLRVIDPKELFEKEGDPMRYHFRKDPHWNREGHEKAAQAIEPFIQ